MAGDEQSDVVGREISVNRTLSERSQNVASNNGCLGEGGKNKQE